MYFTLLSILVIEYIESIKNRDRCSVILINLNHLMFVLYKKKRIVE